MKPLSLQPEACAAPFFNRPRRPDETTILVVDDYPTLGQILSSILRLEGYNVLTASSGEEAKEFFDACAGIDLLLSDQEMPQMQGDELAAWVCRKKPGTPILLMSSKPIHPFHFLRKPFQRDVLLRTVRDILRCPASRAENPTI